MRTYVHTRFGRGKSTGVSISIDGLAILQKVTSHIVKQLEGPDDSSNTMLARLVESLHCVCDDSRPHRGMQVVTVATVRIPMPGRRRERFRMVESYSEFCPSNRERDWGERAADHLLHMIADEVRRTWRRAGVRLGSGLICLQQRTTIKAR